MRIKIQLALLTAAACLALTGCGPDPLEAFNGENETGISYEAQAEETGETDGRPAGAACETGEPQAEESRDGPGRPADPSGENANKREETPASGTLCIDICGAVTNPGVYCLPDGSRVTDAVEAADGLKPEADLKRLNRAKYLADGEKIIVYAVGEDASPVETDMTLSGGGSVPGSGININTAGMTELQTLTGIGEAKARAIVEDRQKNGAFKDPEDIMRVSGIGEGVFGRIREKITV